jgi:sulfate transport system permease protein
VPLQVEILYNEYNWVAAFSLATLLMILALVTLLAKNVVERRFAAPGGAHGGGHG